MTTIGILGSGQVGSTIARAAVAAGYDIVIANRRGPETLAGLISGLGPRARAARPAEAAAAGDFVVLAFPYMPGQRLPAEELAGKIVLDPNNYMVWRDGNYPEVDAGLRTVHELRQEQLPAAKIAKAFSHIQHHARSPIRVPGDALPGLFRLARPAGAPDRKALTVSSDHPDAVELVTEFYDRLGFDTVNNSPLSESWRTAPGTPAWQGAVDGQTREELLRDLQRAERPTPERPDGADPNQAVSARRRA